MNKYKWQKLNETALEYATNTSFNVNADSEFSARFKQYLDDGRQVDPADVEPIPVIYIPMLTIVDRLEAIGKRTAVKEALAQNDYLLDRWNALREGIEKNDAQVRALFTSLEINPDEILY
jgi:hypothetical protein